MNNIAGALYRVTKIKNEVKCSRRMRSVSRQCQFKQPCLQAARLGIRFGGGLGDSCYCLWLLCVICTKTL